MLGHRLIIVAGKGGVGRTTIAAALGVVLARRGRRTLVAHVRSQQRLDLLLGTEQPVGDGIVQVEPDLWAVNMDPRAAIREMGLLVLRFRSVYRFVLENRIVRSFLRAVPALEDYSMVGKAWYHTTELLPSGEPRFDTVVFDGPATGHLISMLRVPQVILDAVPEGPLTRDARKARELLRDRSQTCICLVTLAEEMAASEAVDLFHAARDDLGIAVDRLLINQLYPAELGTKSVYSQVIERLEALQDLPPGVRDLLPAVSTFAARRRINDRSIAKLAQEIPVAQIELPHLFEPQLGRRELELLADLIAAGLDRASTAHA